MIARIVFAFVALSLALQPILHAQPDEEVAAPEVAWHDVREWGVEGRAWGDEERARYFDRFPASAEATLRKKVWDLSRTPTGMLVLFETDASEIWIRYEVQSEDLGFPHFPASGVSGLDLYARDESGAWRWVQATKPRGRVTEMKWVDGLAPGKREYAVYLPLRNPLENLEIGVLEGESFQGLAPRLAGPIVFYGTSINHGVAASRPGMVHTAILGRWFDRPVVNLGFGGNGRMETEVGVFLERLEAAVFVIDCLPNMGPETVRERCGPLVKQLRRAHPDTPIILVEDRRYANAWIRPEKNAFHDQNQAALKEAYEELRDEGVDGLYYIEGDGLFGSDNEGTVDGSHPTDLGYMRQAEVFKPVLEAALEGRK